MINTKVVNFVNKYKERIDLAIAQELANRLTEVKAISPHLVPILSAMQELSSGGKRLRGLLTILGYQLAGQKVDKEIIKAAAVMEIFHLGLLIQDDVMDEDHLRRGVKTIHSRYTDRRVGESVGMLAGDYTFGWGMETLSGLSLPPKRVNAGMAIWGKYFTRVGYGQTLDVIDIADDRTILQILAIKSGEYSCVLPLVIGATLGGGENNLLERLRSYAMELGWVFQLRDDWLGMYGESIKTGKPAGEQEAKGKKTFATMYGKERTESAIKEHLMIGKDILRGFSSKYGEVMNELLEWMATREN